MNSYNYFGQSPMRGMNPNYMRPSYNDYPRNNDYTSNLPYQENFQNGRGGYNDDARINMKSYRGRNTQFEAPYKSHYIQRPSFQMDQSNGHNYQEDYAKTINGFPNGHTAQINNDIPKPYPMQRNQSRENHYHSLEFTKKHSSFEGNTAQFEIPDYQPPKKSLEKFGCIQGYAASTNRGIVREANEDRVSIITNIEKVNCPPASFFGIYDGHGGYKCAEFLQENLHQFVLL